MAHSFMKEVFAECLRVVYGKGGNKGNDHLPHQGISRSPEAQYTLCCVHEVLAHELRCIRIGTSIIEREDSPCHHEEATPGM